MKPTVYVETSIISYLVARPSRDVVALAMQEATRAWWARRAAFVVLTSALVRREAAAGDPAAAALRLETLKGTRILEVTDEARALAVALARALSLPRKAAADALHVAIAAVNGADYLVTWNCRHIANVTFQRTIAEVCRDAGVEPPVIGTPQEFPEK